MNKSFGKIQGSKNRSVSSSFISLHFNKADEDQLEINYGEADEKKGESSKKDDASLVSTTIHSSSEDANRCDEIRTEDTTEKPQIDSKDSIVRDYWSRISKRASSVDSDLGGGTGRNSDPSERWMFIKDIKDKLAKKHEEKKPVLKIINKDDKTSESDSERTPTEMPTVLLSPAIEANEVKLTQPMFEDYINDELDRAKCEILSSKPKNASESQFPQRPKKVPSKSALMAISENKLTPVSAKECVPETNDSSESRKTVLSSDDSSNSHLQIMRIKIQNSVNFVKSHWKNVIFRILIAILALIFAPIPSWISGFSCGAILSGFLVYLLLKPVKPKLPFIEPDFSKLPPSNIVITEVADGPIIHSGWMNELPFELSYDPDSYHVNSTRSIYIRLDGSELRVSYPPNNIPKRAMFNERRHELQFVHQRHYNITGATVELLPEKLTRKRLWSKKYPLSLIIPNSKQTVLIDPIKDSSEPNPVTRTSTSRNKESPFKRMVPRVNEKNEVILYLFARTDREKDLWYNRFKKASRPKFLKSHSPSSSSPNIAALEASLSLEKKRTISVDLASLQLTVDSNNSPDSEVDGFSELSMTKQQKFELYMSHLLTSLHFDHQSLVPTKDRKEAGRSSSGSSETRASLAWLNVLIGRVFFDFLTENVWATLVTEKIQKKLSKIKLPAFLNELTVKDINLGTALPKIHRASEPAIDQRGLWIDIDLSYNGSFQMTLETKINLMKFKCDTEEFSINGGSKDSVGMVQNLRSPVYNSEEEDSADTSSDEGSTLPEAPEGVVVDGSTLSTAGGSATKKMLQFANKLAQSTYFQSAAKNKYIKKAMEDISNTPLVLTVEVQWLTGTLALNIPPMPTDRLWYGFRTNPHLSIVARPKLGQKVVTFSHVIEWIEKKLVSEFQKILVMPNMDDLIIPIMQADSDFI